MERPSVCLWEKDYPVKMKEWVVWHVEHTDIDNKKDFVRWFMQYSRGHISPQTVIEAWDFKKGVDRVVKYNENVKHVFNQALVQHYAFYDYLISEGVYSETK